MLSHITIIAAMRCDLKCAHCLRGFPKECPDFPMDLLDKLLTEALPFGAKHVAITGGEPHLHPDFEAMVDKIVAYGYTWHFVTNCQRTEPYLRVMEKHKDKVSHVAVSIDGATAETHDEIRK
jgi:MoaA/NifB/PqqE/SkfB family radical SAM enzyme